MLAIPLLLASLFLSIIWDIYFVRRIRSCIKSYRKNAENAIADPFGNFSEAANQRKSEIVKYVFMLLINVTEFVDMQIYGLGSILANEPKSYEHIFMPNRVTISNCTSELTQHRLFDLHLITANPINSIILSFGQVGLMFSLALVSCLMKYLHVSYRNTYLKPFQSIKVFLLVTSLIGIFLLITGSVQQLMIVHKLIEPIVQLVYFCIWIRNARIFHKTLEWRTIELRVRRCNNRVVRRSIIGSYQFALIMSCMGVATACLILSEFLEEYLFLIATAIYYGPCLFNYLYSTPYFQPLLVTQQQINALLLSYEIKAYTTTFLVITACVLIGAQYISSTALFFGRKLKEKLDYRFGRVRVRFSPELTRRLLPRS